MLLWGENILNVRKCNGNKNTSRKLNGFMLWVSKEFKTLATLSFFFCFFFCSVALAAFRGMPTGRDLIIPENFPLKVFQIAFKTKHAIKKTH